MPLAPSVIPDLQALARSGDAPFALTLADGTRLECRRIVRRVPGQRLVCAAEWQQRPVYAKIFIGTHAARHAARDRRGAQWLDWRQLPTPGLLHAGALPQGAGEVLLYTAIVDSANAEEVMQGLQTPAQRLALALALTHAVADHHTAGLLQTDLYLKNFLVQGPQLYTLDGDGIRRLRSRRAALANLARLLSKFDAADDGWIPELYAAYCQRRAQAASPVELGALDDAVRRIRREVLSEYADRKVFRNCSDVQVTQEFSSYRAVARAWVGRLGGLLEQPDRWLEQGVRLKSGNTCTVALVEHEGRKIVVKRYNIKNLRHRLGRAWRRSRAAQSWANTYRLQLAGIPTAAPVALLEQRWGPLRGQAWLLSEYVDGPDLAQWMEQATPAQRELVAERVAGLLHKLQRMRFAHGDLKASNIKIVEQQPLLIDLDSLRQYRCDWLFQKRHARDLRRLLKNWENDAATLGLMRQALSNVYENDPVLTGLL